MTENFLWWQKAVIYQIYPRSFQDTTGNGIGDLPGIIQRLPYLGETLGIDAIWLSPFYPSPMEDFGYDVENYIDVDPIFGTLADFDELIVEAHQRGIRIIIDLVPNHTSDQHEWFLESRSSRNNHKRDWYVWADPKPDGSPPNNWLSVFGGPAWEWDNDTQQYYLHSFLKEQPDLNWRNPAVKQAIFNVVRFWLIRGVDGFRIDVAHYILKDPALKDNPLNPHGGKSIHKSLGEYDSQIHINDKGHPDVHKVYKEFRTLLDEYSLVQSRVSVGEIHIFDRQEWVRYYGKNLDEIHLPYNFSLLGVRWQANDIRKNVEDLEACLPLGAWPNYVLGTHDDHRLTSRFGKSQTRTAAMLLLTLRGTPTLYYGDEIGMTDVEIPPDRVKDPAGINQPNQGRDTNRTPMQWSPGPHGGFSPPSTAEPWLPLSDNYREVNVKMQLDDPGSLLNFYRTLLSIRKGNPVLETGSYQSLTNSPENCFLFLRKNDRDAILVALNFGAQSQPLPPSLMQNREILLSTYLDLQGSFPKKLTLRPHEGIIIRL